MVREDQVQLARSILEAEIETDPNLYQADDDQLSDTSKAVLGLTAIAFNPIGTGIAFGISKVIGRRDAAERAYIVECVQCGTALELTDQEVAQGRYTCPECKMLVQLDAYVVCPTCQAQLALDKSELQQGWYRCPDCDQVTKIESPP